jgi:hypothetical protein
MLYADELDTSVAHISNYSEIFSLQLTKVCFLDLLNETGLTLDQFSNKLARKQPVLFPLNGSSSILRWTPVSPVY